MRALRNGGTAMSKSVTVVLRRAPYGGLQAAEAVRHLNGGVANGMETSLLLLGDGVYVARQGQAAAPGWTSLSEVLVQVMKHRPRRPGGSGGAVGRDGGEKQARVCVHGGALAERGLGEGDLVPGVEVVDDEGAALLVAGSDATIVY
jgi:sulfur relay (sulfurtransferase) DsrF/TusC family protein